MKETSPITMKDIARELGVSVATVSRALKDSPRIKNIISFGMSLQRVCATVARSLSRLLASLSRSLRISISLQFLVVLRKKHLPEAIESW